MRFICLGYADLSKFETMSESELGALMEESFAFDDTLQKGGHFAGGDALPHSSQAITLRDRKSRKGNR